MKFRQTAGRDFAEMESVLARLLDVMLVALGAALASLLFKTGTAHSSLEGAFVALDMALAILLLPLFGIYDSWRGRSKWRLAFNIVFGWIAVQLCGLAIMFLLHRTALVSRLWCVSWTVMTAVGLVASRLLVHTVLGRIRRAPCSRIAARCGPRATKLTSAPARASCTPIKPPIAPAPKIQIFMMLPL